MISVALQNIKQFSIDTGKLMTIYGVRSIPIAKKRNLARQQPPDNVQKILLHHKLYQPQEINQKER